MLQGTTYVVIRQANRNHALGQIDSSLRTGAQIFEKLIEQHNQQISTAATILSRDHAFQAAFAGSEEDRDTTLSALESLRQRVKADVVLIASLEKELLFDLNQPQLQGIPFPFPRLIDQAENTTATNAFVVLDHRLYAMAVTPLLAPDPIAWLCPGFQINDDFAREFKTYAHAEITFLSGENLFATTIEDDERGALLAVLQRSTTPMKQIFKLHLGSETFISYAIPLAVENGTAIAFLQRSLDRELTPQRRLERTFLALALLGLAISVALALAIAGTVSKPVLQLATGALKISAGDYGHRVVVRQQDELGTLATTFNKMSQGLAERDRVRDLLGKVVSPEVATELLRKDLALGGEEREVTILFSDLRNFTGVSEALPPQEMVGILNHYFTRMSAIVEKHGGVVDKYIGDALMALFGAPLGNADDADRAMQTALEMIKALDELNQEWSERGLPEIAIGIGINTDVVVAGNMGSTTRLNYTVIGDGVNLASRLEGLTKVPEYEARIIISASTLAKARERYRTHPLGEVAVKGKQKPTEIFALLSRA